MMTTTTHRMIEAAIVALDANLAQIGHDVESTTARLDDLVRRRTALQDQRRDLAADLDASTGPDAA